MKRKLFNELSAWKDDVQRKPILLTGARGVGKTYLAYDFAKAFYSKSIYLNLEREPYLYDLFSGSQDFAFINKLKERYHITDVEEPVLLIIDEIADCPDIAKLLRVISKADKALHILAISSSFVDTSCSENDIMLLQLYPLDFEEYLTAIGNEWYIEVIRSHYESNKALPDIVHKELLAYFEDYLEVGGMPAAVNEYVNMDSKLNVPEKHRILIDSYLRNVNKRNMDGTALKIHQVFATLDSQLIKDNRKFRYTMIRKGATQAIYEDALDYLQDTFYGIPCYRAADEYFKDSPAKIPFKVEKTDLHPGFKLFLPDVGILHSMIRARYGTLTEPMKKGILENFVAQSLIANGYPIIFWESGSQAKVDFITWNSSGYIPMEVRTNSNTRSKNISVFKTKCRYMKDSIKISTKNFEYSNGVKYVPVYAVFCI